MYECNLVATFLCAMVVNIQIQRVVAICPLGYKHYS